MLRYLSKSTSNRDISKPFNVDIKISRVSTRIRSRNFEKKPCEPRNALIALARNANGRADATCVRWAMRWESVESDAVAVRTQPVGTQPYRLQALNNPFAELTLPFNIIFW